MEGEGERGGKGGEGEGGEEEEAAEGEGKREDTTGDNTVTVAALTSGSVHLW